MSDQLERAGSGRLFFPDSAHFKARKMVMSTWVDHMPFAYDLIAQLRPSKVVELGTHNGLSFFVFCQAMIEASVDGTVYAVDTWQGDDHTGAYGEEVFESVRDHARAHYRGVSYLLRTTFDEARTSFAEASIDLLHIDGLHTYDAVKHDFETWLPAVRPGGIILFHDIEARMQDFGVWKFWQEIEADYETFAFSFGFGLGVLRVPGGPAQEGALFDALFSKSAQDRLDLQRLYTMIGHYHEVQRKLARVQGNN